MRFKILTILSLILLFSGCKKKLENEEAELIEQNNTQGVSEKDIEDLGLERIVIGACSPRYLMEIFQLTQYYLLILYH